MAYHSIVLVKQVPDTKAVTGKAMKDDGTVNRSALPAVFNPEDLNALEMALQVRERYGGTVRVITMGPPMASEVLRDALYRGADGVVLLTDKRFAAADTLATSYTLNIAIRKMGSYDLIFCGRQAIDGDTAQVGPQTAEKLGLPQLTYVGEILEIEEGAISVRRSVEGGYEVVKAPMPSLVTVVATANDPRPASAKRIMKYKKARTKTGLQNELRAQGISQDEMGETLRKRIESLEEAGLMITEWNADDIGIELDRCGIAGSPTWVKGIESVVLSGKDFKLIEASYDGVAALVHELIEDHTFG